MKTLTKHSITLNHRRYGYSLKKIDKDTSHVECPAANINQAFLNADIPALLSDLPQLILAEKNYHKQQNQLLRFRVTPEDKQRIEHRAQKQGYQSVSEFLRDSALGKLTA
ncbi:MAG: hypothetical protein WAZ14_00690 [Patescibacteria group bacterium]